jgi:hypothetical protein
MIRYDTKQVSFGHTPQHEEKKKKKKKGDGLGGGGEDQDIETARYFTRDCPL